MNSIYAIATVGPEDHPVNIPVMVVRQHDTPGFFLCTPLNSKAGEEASLQVHQNKLRIAWKPSV